MANRLDQLNAISAQMPGLAQESAAKGQQARMALLQQQLGVAPATKQAVQQVQTQQAGLAGQQAVEQLQQQQAATAQVATQAMKEGALAGEAANQRAAMGQEESQLSARTQMARRLQQESMDSRKRMTEADIASAQKLQALGLDVDSKLQMATQKQRQDLAKLGNGIKEQLIDSRLAFEKDEMGRKFSNDRQLADYVASTAATQQEFQQKMRGLVQISKNEEVMMNALRDRLLTIQKQGYIEKQGDLDAETNKQLAQMAVDAKIKAAKAKAKTSNRIMQAQAVGSVLGAVAGGFIGGPAGAAAGATLGGAAGTVLNGLKF